MFKRKLMKKAPDPERDQLKGIIAASDIPHTIKALAVIGVGRMTPEQVTQALNVVPVLMAAAESKNREGVAQVLREQGLDELTVTDAMSYYDQLVGE